MAIPFKLRIILGCSIFLLTWVMGSVWGVSIYMDIRASLGYMPLIINPEDIYSTGERLATKIVKIATV